MATTTRMTIDEFLNSPLRYEKPYREVIDGVAIPKTGGTSAHQRIEMALCILFRPEDRTGGRGYGNHCLDLRFDDPDDPRFLVPDFLYYSDRKKLNRDVQVHPPDLVAEIRSPGEPLEKLHERVHYYRSHGVGIVWLIDPEPCTVAVWADSQDGVTFSVADRLQIDDVTFAVSELFEEPRDLIRRR